MKNFQSLIIGGGGAGSVYFNYGGGGGAGAYIEGSLSLNQNTLYDITIGIGGLTSGQNGSDSFVVESGTLVEEIRAQGGGGGGEPNGVSRTHASGGGGGGGTTSSFGTGGTGGIYGKNGAGGLGSSSSGSRQAGGGGGAGASAPNNPTSVVGIGGSGLSSNITGSSVFRAGGGGAVGAKNGEQSGGSGGGGNGKNNNANAVDNTGSGGGGTSSGSVGKGGSGVFILRFKTDDISIVNSTGGTVATVGGDTVITWNTNGSFEFTLPQESKTYPATDIDWDRATLHGEVITNEKTITEKGFCYSTSPNPTTSDNKKISNGGDTYYETITGLSPETTYYVRAYAISSLGVSYGQEVSFVTKKEPILTTVETNNPTYISTKRVDCSGEVLDNGFVDINRRGFVISTNTHLNPNNISPETSDYEIVISESGIFDVGEFYGAYKKLKAGTKYYIRAFAQNIVGFSYGNELSFTTVSETPRVRIITPRAVSTNKQESITITGQNFTDGLEVEIDTEPCSEIVVVDSETITCKTPESETQKTATLKVTNPDEKSGTFPFYYMKETPNPEPKPKIQAKLEVGIIETI